MASFSYDCSTRDNMLILKSREVGLSDNLLLVPAARDVQLELRQKPSSAAACKALNPGDHGCAVQRGAESHRIATAWRFHMIREHVDKLHFGCSTRKRPTAPG